MSDLRRRSYIGVCTGGVSESDLCRRIFLVLAEEVSVRAICVAAVILVFAQSVICVAAVILSVRAKSVLQECQVRVSHTRSVLRECVRESVK